MSGARGAGRFSFRMSAEDAQGVVGAFKQVAGQSDQLKQAFDRLIQASPQLASVNDNVQRKMRETAESMKAAGAATKEAEPAFASFGQSFTRAGLIGMGVGAGIQAFNDLREAVSAAMAAIPAAGDAAAQAIGRLSALTGSPAAGLETYGRIQEIARVTGATIDSTTEAFQRFRVAASELGATNSEVLTLIENFQKFAVVNGAGGQALSSATTQLAQALASGKLQGDEFKSIMENLPALAQGLARELGVGVGRLREMASEGKLTGDVIFPALKNLLAGVNVEFDKMPAGIARARNEMDVAATKLYETLDKTFGLSGQVVRKFQQLAGIIQGIESAVKAVTQTEAQFTAAKERQALREEVGAFDATIAEARAVPNPDQDAIAQLVARRDALHKALSAKDAEFERERARAADAAHQATLARTGQAMKEIFDLDKRGAADRELAQRKKTIFDRFVATGDAAEMDRATALAVKDHADAIEKLTEKQKEGTAAQRQTTEAVSEFLKQRDKVEAAGRAAELALDPYAAAWQRAAEQVRDLTAAMELWEESSGARGLSPDRAQQLIGRTQTGLIDSFDKLERGVDKTDAAFNQFFSNATSRAEDAITRFTTLGDLVTAIGEDLARLLIRTGITGPLSEAVSGFIKGQGGASGLVKTGFDFISSFFADGGVMTDKGSLPLRRYASGGIADSPQLAMFGEGATPEAYVPLPDGRAIPVRMQGGRGDTSITVNVGGSNASPALIAGTVAMAVEQAQARIYGDADRGGSAARRLGRRR